MLLQRLNPSKMVSHETIVFKNGDPTTSPDFATNSNETGQVAITIPADVNVISGFSIFPSEPFGAGGFWRPIIRTKTGATTAGRLVATGNEYVHDTTNNEIHLTFPSPVYVAPGTEYWFGWHNSAFSPDLKTTGTGLSYREPDPYADGPLEGARTFTVGSTTAVAVKVHGLRQHTIQKILRANVAITNTNATTAGFVRFGLTMPIEKDAQQELVSISGATGWTTLTNSNGTDRYLFLRPSIPAGSTFTATIDFLMNVSSYSRLSVEDTAPETLTAAQVTTFTGPQSLMESDDPDIVAMANTIKSQQSTTWGRVRAAYEFPRDNYPIRDMATNEGAAYAIKKNTNGTYVGGDCTEFAGTTAALCKAMGFPARMVNVWWGGSDGEVSGDFPNHQRMKVFLPDQDGSGSHWYYLDPNLGTNEELYHYGFAHGGATGINAATTGAFTWSSTSDTTGVVFTHDISYALTNVQP